MKRVIKLDENKSLGKDEWWGENWLCPNCNKVGIWNNFNYCPYCGYKIEWVEEEAETDK